MFLSAEGPLPYSGARVSLEVPAMFSYNVAFVSLLLLRVVTLFFIIKVARCAFSLPVNYSRDPNARRARLASRWQPGCLPALTACTFQLAPSTSAPCLVFPRMTAVVSLSPPQRTYQRCYRKRSHLEEFRRLRNQDWEDATPDPQLPFLTDDASRK